MFLPTRSYAKVNLCLAVAPPLPGPGPHAGWHPIASWFHCVGLYDDLSLEHIPHGTTSIERASAPDAAVPIHIDWPLESDLVFRAHAAVEQFVKRTLPVRISLRKRIPSGGGLGGGSSNAATTLRGLNSLFGLELTTDELLSLARPLGSDVAFFLDESPLDAPAAPALVEGFGNAITRVPRRADPITLCIPPFGCATPAVYHAFDELPFPPFRDAAARTLASSSVSPAALDPHTLFNDLTSAAQRVQPRLGDVLQSCRAAAGHACLSGSGSTLFMLGHVHVGSVPLIHTRLV